MAFANTILETASLGDGLVMEKGTWTFNSGGAVTTGTITLGTATNASPTFNVKRVLAWFFASDGDNAVNPALDVYPNQIKITGTSADTGTYTVIGEGI